MLTKEQRKRIAGLSKKAVAGNDRMHGIAHLEETAKLAVWLAKKEKGDPDVCWVSAMLHDICKGKPGDHGARGSRLAAKILLDEGFSGDFVKKVRDAIYFHNREFTKGPIERMILWDADKLPLMAIRGFSKRMLPYWIMVKGRKAGTKKSVDEYYFYKSRFHTKTAKIFAEKHSAAMERFLKKHSF